ncbi:MAG: acyl-CoA dehydrogenase family protein, partial [Bdellovibrionaceae bacterium]|nr:acyl-CoA dehydrogenase family protein [Pseudobdellovibrionaceae bacterium]
MDQLLQCYGYFLENGSCTLAIIGFIFLFLFIGFFNLPLFVWAIAGLICLFGFGAPMWLLGAFAMIMLVFIITPIRANIVSKAVMALFEKLQFIPKISATERTALEAGVVWIEKDLFSGKPNFTKILKEPYAKLTAEEQAFINGPVEELCQKIEPYKVWRNKEMPPEIWDMIKNKGFLGMIIPKEYGGLGFTAMAHSEVIMKISSRSLPACISVMVPNSLGPAELLIHYGTEAQKNYWLPRLAAGQELPCFGLTEPLAGSDAGSVTSSGVVFKDANGQLSIRLNWNKRWTTLAPIASVIGLA